MSKVRLLWFIWLLGPLGCLLMLAACGGGGSSPNAITGSVVGGGGTTPSPPPTASNATAFYVATNGNDSSSGTQASPFATLGRAQQAVRSVLQNPGGQTSITVTVGGGTYFVTQPLQFTSADSGTSSLSVVWQNQSGETPVVSGGMRITGWKNSGGNQWEVTLPSSIQFFEQLFYNGQRRLRPRLGSGTLGTYYRIAGTVSLASNSDPNCAVQTSSGFECFDRFLYDPSDPISGSWANLNAPYPQGDIELYYFAREGVSKLRIKSVDTSNHIVYLTGPTVQQPNASNGFMQDHRYLVENVKNALSQPGQWFLDRSATPWTLTYLANSGENPNNDTVIVPQSSQVLTATGLQNVTFNGLTFQHDNYTVADQGHNVNRFDTDVTEAVDCYNCQNVTFESITITQTSGGGIGFITNSVSGTSAHNTFQDGAIYDVGAHGIRVGVLATSTDTDANVPQFTTVKNNVIAGLGRVFPTGIGIVQGDAHDNTYTQNEIYDGYFAGVEICALNCPPGTSNSKGAFNNVVSFNHAYNLGQGLTNDFGCFYINTAAVSGGNQFLNNRCHDVSDSSSQDSDGFAGEGIYVDNVSSGVMVKNNLVYRVSGSALTQTCGPQTPSDPPNTFMNNIVAYGRLGIKLEGCVPQAATLQFNFSNNLVYYDRGMIQLGCAYCFGGNCATVQNYQSNLYCYAANATCALPQNPFRTTDGQPGQMGNCHAQQYYPSLQAWQAIGEDVGSVVQNPKFTNPTYPADDFSLPSGSPGVGFSVFDLGQIGRSNPVIAAPSVAATFPTKPFDPAVDY